VVSTCRVGLKKQHPEQKTFTAPLIHLLATPKETIHTASSVYTFSDHLLAPLNHTIRHLVKISGFFLTVRGGDKTDDSLDGKITVMAGVITDWRNRKNTKIYRECSRDISE
jgi:hypothetical protein